MSSLARNLSLLLFPSLLLQPTYTELVSVWNGNTGWDLRASCGSSAPNPSPCPNAMQCVDGQCAAAPSQDDPNCVGCNYGGGGPPFQCTVACPAGTQLNIFCSDPWLSPPSTTPCSGTRGAGGCVKALNITCDQKPGICYSIQCGKHTVAGRTSLAARVDTEDASPAAPSSAGATKCDGELLYNGVCLPKNWPPMWNANGSGGLPPRNPAEKIPPYILNPPKVINVSVGRQLFVDTFLIESMVGLQLINHAADWHGQVMRASEPWEAWRGAVPPQPDYPQGPLDAAQAGAATRRALHGVRSTVAMPFSGGVWWDETLKTFRAWYLCGSEVATKGVGCCYATSVDGITWNKPLDVGKGDVNGTNIVYEELFNGNVVWLDHDTKNPAEKWKMATVPNNLNLAQFRLLVSSDGLHWQTPAGDGGKDKRSGPIGDRSSFFYNAFRKKWVWSIKERWGGSYNRARSYYEADHFVAGSNWTSCKGGVGAPCRATDATSASCPCPWTSADAADPAWPYNQDVPSELYNLDGTAYESLMVGLFSIFRGYVAIAVNHYPHQCLRERQLCYILFMLKCLQTLNADGDVTPLSQRYSDENASATANVRSSDEQNEIYLGFSRDGFHWWRQHDGSTQAGGSSPLPRKVFMGNDWPTHTWRRADVQSVGGGFTVVGDKLHIYSSGNSDLPFSSHGSRGNKSMGLATLRRDGFTSVESLMSQPGVLTTRPIAWHPNQTRLWANVVIQPGGFIQAAVLSLNETTGLFEEVLGLVWNASSVGGLAPNTCVDPWSPAGKVDSTRAEVTWSNSNNTNTSLSIVSGKVVKLRWRLSGASLYSFWVSASACGESGGYLAAGGPGSIKGKDLRGKCEEV